MRIEVASASQNSDGDSSCIDGIVGVCVLPTLLQLVKRFRARRESACAKSLGVSIHTKLHVSKAWYIILNMNAP
jgi:hypothetical protein